MHKRNDGVGAGWVAGDRYGHPMPVDPDSLRIAGPTFLTAAFRASGALPEQGSVSAVTAFREIDGGSTGRKAMLSVEYAKPETGRHTELFVKFSRDLDNPTRDLGKTQMESEVRFAELSRSPGFPIAVPDVLFGDYQRRSGTGILITERIPFGTNGIEPQYHKCLDYRMPEPLRHYRALLTALARLAGAHRSGRLPAETAAQFPLDVAAATVGERPALSADRLDRRLTRLGELTRQRPGLLPSSVTTPEFLSLLRSEVPRIANHEHSVERLLCSDPDYIALCHWNANVDNAWFWRDGLGELHCGLLDWGCVSQLNLGMALWGAMSGAETEMWDRHLDDLLTVFVDEFRHCGGPRLDLDRLRRDLLLYAATMGVAWLLDVPALLWKRFGDDVPHHRSDPRIGGDESLRAPLQMLSNVLNLWQRHRIGELLDAATEGPST